MSHERMRSLDKIGNRGRKKKIDFQIFEKLCALFCTKQEIADAFGVEVETLERRVKENYKISFRHAYERFRANGKISLRRCQFKQAEKSAAMAIWLGRNYLEQGDKEADSAFTITQLKSIVASIDSTSRDLIGDHIKPSLLIHQDQESVLQESAQRIPLQSQEES